MTRHTTRVAIIGAGATGLAQLKQLIEAFSRVSVRARTHLEVVVFEGKNEVGGVW
jgi:cation diffusion facilitator CzcD-associated flavoprotein CzcO